MSKLPLSSLVEVKRIVLKERLNLFDLLTYTDFEYLPVPSGVTQIGSYGDIRPAIEILKVVEELFDDDIMTLQDEQLEDFSNVVNLLSQKLEKYKENRDIIRKQINNE